ncbi:biotin/lipoyl-containing protein [Chitinilyticum litopenaei]|uniref:biotin/lipoyl-containing protein n=1 Tax=Chitinilyticum litopenaei TaxID=1121276 RepID=UPI0004167036|nr:biotin/lipoyl-containing protein [Chitinilyticum litopenaei]
MTETYTTHLICAPELDEPALVLAIGPQNGHAVDADALLVRLLASGEELHITAPDAGQVGAIMVSVGDSVVSGDLLLLMEIREAPTQLYPLQTEEAAYAPVCQQAWPAPAAGADEFVVTRAAARLAARLGIDLAEVAQACSRVDEEQVFAYARRKLQS